MRKNAPVLCLLLIFGVLCAQYIRITPYRTSGILLSMGRAQAPDIGAPDERQHANYVAHLLGGIGFPVLRPGAPDGYEHYQSHQPPLYYLLSAGFCRLVGIEPADSGGGSNLRYLNLIIGLGGVLGLYACGKWGSGSEPLGLCMAAVGGFLPMNVALCAAVSNDPLLIALCTWTVALLLRASNTGWNYRVAVVIGLLTGLALLTKTLGVVLLPTIAVAWRQSTRRQTGSAAALTGANRWLTLGLAVLVPLALVSPWWIRNQSLYGDPLAMQAFKEAFQGTAQAADFITAFGAYRYWTEFVGWYTLRSFIGVFGYMDIFLSAVLYAVAAGVLAILALLGLGPRPPSDVRGSPTAQTDVRAIFLTLLFFVGMLFVQFNLTYFQGQARYLFPAIAAIAWFVASGMARLSGRHVRLASVLTVGALIGLNLYVLSLLPGEFALRAI